MEDYSVGPDDKIEVDEFPNCLICGKEARFSALTGAGLWCCLCEGCFKEYGLGIGPTDGHILVLKPKGGKDADL